MTSLRSLTGRIRHLDHHRARQLVELFARPVLGADPALGYDSRDQVSDSSQGWLTLHADHHGTGETVGHFATQLFLHELLRLPLSVARVLARHRGHLYLDKLVRISDAVADVLGAHVGGGLSLNNLRRISPAQARSLARHEHELSLNSVRTLDLEQARRLARHANELHLAGLEELPARAAAALARQRGDLVLGGPRRLTRAVAEHLAGHGGKLHLHGVTALTAATAGALGNRRGYLCLNQLSTITAAQAERLAGHEGVLVLSSLEVNGAVAACLGDHVGGLVVRLSDGCGIATLAAVLRHRGAIHIDGLTTVDADRARVLAGQRRGRRGLTGLDGLFLPDVRRLTPPVAAILATHRGGELSLRGIGRLTEETAGELVGHPLLALDGLESVSDRVAKILARHDGGTLSLAGLESVSPRGLAALRANPDVILPRRLAGPEPAGGPSAGPGRSGAELAALIDQIAAAGEERLG